MTTPRAWKEAASSLQTRAEELSLELPVTKEVNDIRERPTSRTGMGGSTSRRILNSWLCAIAAPDPGGCPVGSPVLEIQIGPG